ncbi:MAG: hypothetical protein AAGB29_13380 [Planctomycetota bacterium]
MANRQPGRLAATEVVAAAVSNATTLALLANPASDGGSWAMTAMTLGLAAGSAAALVLGAVGLYRLLSGPAAGRDERGTRWVGPVSTAALLVSVIAAAGLGQASALVAGLAALGAVTYAGVARFLPAVGVVSLGLLAGASMLVADPRMGPVWPVMLTMTHVMACASARVSSRQRRPAWTGRDTLLAVAGWCFWSLVWLSVSTWRAGAAGPSPTGLWLAVGAAIAFAAAAVVTRGGVMRSAWAVRAMHVYNAAWLIGSGEVGWASLPVALGLIAWTADRWIGLTGPPTPKTLLQDVRKTS